MKNTLAKRYFAAANSAYGFHNSFCEIFSPDKLQRVYIIKGGPGTGKSYLMKNIAKIAEEKNYDVEYFYCSSDINSLDGIIINDIKTAVIDGTAPHTAEPKYPGAVDVIVNTGEFFDENKLVSQRDEIKSLIALQTDSYNRAYRYLCAAKEVDNEILHCVKKAFFFEKMNAAAKRLFDAFSFDDKKGNTIKRYVSAIGPDGFTYFDTFNKLAKRRYAIADILGTGHIFLEKIYALASEKGIEMTVAYSPFDCERLEAIYFPNDKISITVYEKERIDEENTEKIINMQRFIDQNELKKYKSSIKFAKKCKATLIEGALENFARVKNIHSNLEGIYIKAMDFSAKESFDKALYTAIFEKNKS